MRRREFILTLGGAAAWPLAARAQQPAMPVIGFLRNTSPDDSARLLTAFHEGLNETGFVEHRNVGIEYRWAQNRNDRLAGLATDLVRRQVIAIVASGDASSLAAKAATPVVPIIFVTGADPIQIGLVASLNQPGGNITGVYWLGGAALEAKRAELLHELTPKAATVGYLRNPNSSTGELAMKEMHAAAQALGQEIVVLSVRGERDLEAAFANLAQQRVEAILVGADALFFSLREQIVALAERYRVPAIYQGRAAAEAGGLVSYGPSITDAHRQGGTYVGRILKGEKPGDLPVMQPTKFELVINIKTAKALGLNIPDKLLALADEVIE